MSTSTILFCLSDARLGNCLNCPHYMSLNTSISDCRAQRIVEARKIVEKYQEIEEIMSADLEHIHPLDRDKYRVISIMEVINDVD